MSQRFFIDRRNGNDRRRGLEQRQNPRLDLPHRRRRRGTDRRISKSRDMDFISAPQFQIEDFHFLQRKH